MFFFNPKIAKRYISFVIFSFVFISISVGYINIHVLNGLSITEPLLLILISVLLIVHNTKNGILSTVNFNELFYLFFVTYVTSKNMLLNTFHLSSMNCLLFSVILYYGLKFFFLGNNPLKHSGALLSVYGIILVAYLVVAVKHIHLEKEEFANFFTPNISIFSILLASQISFALPLCLHYKSQKGLKILMGFLFILISASVSLLVLTKGRAGWLGLILATAYIIYQSLSNPPLKKIVLYLTLPIFIISSSLFFGYKSDSSSGRILIYKVSAEMLKDNWLLGIGQGQFKVQYNKYQAAYFSSNSIDSKEAQLADSTIYAFNDYFQVLIENGVMAFALLLTAIYLLTIQIKRGQTDFKNKHLFTAATASFICILTGGVFSYPFQILPIAVQTIVCIAIINSFSQTTTKKINLFKTGSYILKLALVVLNIILIISFCFYLNYKTKSKEAFKLKRAGFKQKAIEAYKDIRSSQFMDDDALYSYAQELHYNNQLLEAKEVIDKAKKYYTSNEVYKLSAAIEKELRNYSQAEKDYKVAIYMVPNRMLSRKNLLEFYLERKDTVNAIYWSNSIINMPVKFPSQITRNIQQKTSEILLQLSR